MKTIFCLFALIIASFSITLTAQADTVTLQLTGVNPAVQGGDHVGPVTPATAGALNWINLAKGINLSNYDFSGFRLHPPVDCSKASPQEFIAKIPGAPVPEPTTLVLLGSGLAGLASLLKKRNRDKDSTDE